MSIKDSFIVTLILRDTIGWRTTIIDKAENALELRRRERVEETKHFQNKDKKGTFDIRKRILNHSSKFVVSLIECKSYSKQYVRSTITSFHDHFNNYKSEARKVSKVHPKKCNIYIGQFHRHFNSEEHNWMEDYCH